MVADGHTLNFQVINPFTGKPCRATLLGFLDWKSGGLVGYDIMLEECTQNIASALRNKEKIPCAVTFGRMLNIYIFIFIHSSDTLPLN